MPVAACVLGGTAAQLNELIDHLVLARLGESEAGDVAVRLRVLAEVVEARVAVPRALGGLRVNLVQIIKDRLHRGVQAVEVESVEADLFLIGRELVVVCSQPADKIEHVGVAPHPGGEAKKPSE